MFSGGGGVCVIGNDENDDHSHHSLMMSLSFLGGFDDFSELMNLPEHEDDACEMCSDFNKSGSQFPTNHLSSECRRCPTCKAWMKTHEKLINHFGSCRGKQVCKFFAAGYCKNGDDCEFSHEKHSHLLLQTHQPHKPHSQLETQRSFKKQQRNIFLRQRCVFFDGKCGDIGCKKGESCPFKHGDAPCSQCGGEQHDQRHCVQCFNCDEWGHVAANCPIAISK